jgi:hypothetical protein
MAALRVEQPHMWYLDRSAGLLVVVLTDWGVYCIQDT